MENGQLIEIIGQHPYVDNAGISHDELVYYIGIDGCYIKQDNGTLYEDAVENYPCKKRYYATDIPIKASDMEEIEEKE